MRGVGRITVAAMLVVAVAACANPTPASVDPTSPNRTAVPSPDQSGEPPPRLAPAVRNPKDARAIAPCDLLSTAQQIELGFRPGSGEPGVAGAAMICSWRTDRPGQPAGLQVNTDPTIPSLDGIYLVRDTFAVFEPLEVAGHPAVRADLTLDSGCVIYTAIADYQGMATGTDILVSGQADPCAGSIRMAELILSNLPPLR